MNQVILATFEDGVLKPDTPLECPPMTRFRLIVEPLTDPDSSTPHERTSAWNELDQLWDEVDFDSGAPPPSRDQLYDRH
jgi:predicted DNA-binding antitoxin AbrB/MazE fold protein